MKHYRFRATFRNMAVTVFVSIVCAMAFSSTVYAKEAEKFIPFRSYLMSYCTAHATENDLLLIQLWEKLMVEEANWNDTAYSSWAEKYYSDFTDLDGQVKSSKGVTFTFNETLSPFFYSSIENNSTLVPEYLSHQETYDIILWYLRRGYDINNPSQILDRNCTDAVVKSTFYGDGLEEIDKYQDAVEAYIRILTPAWEELSQIQKEWIKSHTDFLNKDHEDNKNSTGGSIIQNNSELYDTTARSPEGANSLVNQQEFFDYVVDSGNGLGDFINNINGVKEPLESTQGPAVCDLQGIEDLFGGDGDCKNGCSRCDEDQADYDAKAYEIAFGKSEAMETVRKLIEANESAKELMHSWVDREWAIHTPYIEITGIRGASAKTDGITNIKGTNSGNQVGEIIVSNVSNPEFLGNFEVFGAEIEKITCSFADNVVDAQISHATSMGSWTASMGDIFPADGIYEMTFVITDSTNNSYTLTYKTGRDTGAPTIFTSTNGGLELDTYNSEDSFLYRNGNTDFLPLIVIARDEMTAIKKMEVRVDGKIVAKDSYEATTSFSNDQVQNILSSEYTIPLAEDTLIHIEIKAWDALGNETIEHRYVFRTTMVGDLDTSACKKDLVTNGKPQNLINAATSSTGTVVYSTDGEAWSENIPTGTACGDYHVFVKALGNDYYNESETVEFDITIAHNADGVATRPSTCVSNGEQHNYCTSCGGNICNSRVLPTSGHAYSTIDWSPGNCGMRAYSTYRCSNCGHTYTNTGGYGAHQWGDPYTENNYWDGQDTGTTSTYRECRLCHKREQLSYNY